MKKFLIKVNGSQYEVEVEELKNSVEAVEIESKPQPKPAAAPAPKAAAAPAVQKADTAVPSGASKVVAPMPGTILRINCKVGDSVKKGQVLLILEAMKMENEIVAPSDGIIASINAAQGASVNANDVLLSIN